MLTTEYLEKIDVIEKIVMPETESRSGRSRVFTVTYTDNLAESTPTENELFKQKLNVDPFESNSEH